MAALQPIVDQQNELADGEVTATNLAATRQNASLLHERGDYLSAANLYKQMVKLAPDDFDLVFNYGSLLYKLKSPLESLEYYKKAANLQPNNTVVMAHVVGTLFDLQRYSEVLSYLTEREAQLVNSVALLEYQAKCHIQLKDLEKAQSAYQQIFKIKPEYQPQDIILRSHFLQSSLDNEKKIRLACYEGNYPEFKVLFDLGVSINCQGDKTNRTPLMWLFRGNSRQPERLQILQALMSKSVKNLEDVDGNTAFHHIFLENNFEFFKQIPAEYLKRDNFLSLNKHRQTPLNILHNKILAIDKELKKENLEAPQKEIFRK